MKKYLFVPGNKPAYLAKIDNLSADEIILDLEDANPQRDMQRSVENLIDHADPQTHWIRFPFYDDTSVSKYLDDLTKAGFHRFVYPKLDAAEQLQITEDRISSNFDIRWIVTIESPLGITNLPDILRSSDKIDAVGFGSHDYCKSMNMKHTLANILWGRLTILNTARSCGVAVIDIASMNLSDAEAFQEECRDGFGKGFDGKFLIHPWQIQRFDETSFVDPEELSLALALKKHVRDIGGVEHFTITRLHDMVIEKPHLPYFNRILKTAGYDKI